MGICVQLLNTRIDLQKYEFRRADGQYKICDVKDPFYITAKYRKDNGESGTQLLLGKKFNSLASNCSLLCLSVQTKIIFGYKIPCLLKRILKAIFFFKNVLLQKILLV